MRQVETLLPGPGGLAMHSLVTGPPDAPPAILVAGYGAGAGLWWRNLAALGAAFRVHAVDLLGTGLSSRPPFPATDRQSAEAWFVEHLEAWREAAGVTEPCVLIGHSLGAYLCASYAATHPSSVKHLILVCPAGIAGPPPSWGPDGVPDWAGDALSVRGALFRFGRWAWDRGATPGGVIRALGPVGPNLVRRYVRGRFRDGADLEEAEAAALGPYMYAIAAAPGSGEHALSHLLAPFAWARHPLETRLHEIKA